MDRGGALTFCAMKKRGSMTSILLGDCLGWFMVGLGVSVECVRWVGWVGGLGEVGWGMDGEWVGGGSATKRRTKRRAPQDLDAPKTTHHTHAPCAGSTCGVRGVWWKGWWPFGGAEQSWRCGFHSSMPQPTPKSTRRTTPTLTPSRTTAQTTCL